MADITLTEAAAILGIANPRSARRALDRAGIKATGRSTGRGGENLYDPGDIRALRRLGRGARTDLNCPPVEPTS
jgi:hypothetical protein